MRVQGWVFTRLDISRLELNPSLYSFKHAWWLVCRQGSPDGAPGLARVGLTCGVMSGCADSQAEDDRRPALCNIPCLSPLSTQALTRSHKPQQSTEDILTFNVHEREAMDHHRWFLHFHLFT